jgi:GNAT superfamily N-acetyltransferase
MIGGAPGPEGGTVIEIPEAVRRQALHPFSTLPLAPGCWRVVGRYTSTQLHVLPMPQFVEPLPELTVADVDAAVEEAREAVRAHGRSALVWLTGPDHPWLGDALVQRGLLHEDSSALESTETAMVMLGDPGERANAVMVSVVDSYDAFVTSTDVEAIAFGASGDELRATRAQNADRWNDYASDHANRRWNAAIDGQVVGTAAGAFGEGGLNLFGGAVLPEARGNGVYRALVQARWEAAVRHGTPALTVQAGRMSRPVLEKLGFTAIAEMPTFVDEL